MAAFVGSAQLMMQAAVTASGGGGRHAVRRMSKGRRRILLLASCGCFLGLIVGTITFVGEGHNYSHYSPEEIWHAAHSRHAAHHRREREAAMRVARLAAAEAEAAGGGGSGSGGAAAQHQRVEQASTTTATAHAIKTFDDHPDEEHEQHRQSGVASTASTTTTTTLTHTSSHAAAAAVTSSVTGPGGDQRQQKASPPRPKPIDPKDYPEARNLAALMRDLDLPRGDLVTITFSNSKMAALTMNWALFLRKAGVPHVVGALDEPLLNALRAMGSPTAVYDLPYGNLDGGSSHASDNWKSFAKMRIGQVRALLEMGYDVLMSDVDVVWRRDPRPFLQCGYDHGDGGGKASGNGGGDGGGEDEEEGGEDREGQLRYLKAHGRGVDDCMGISAAEVMVSSDNLSPRHDRDEGALYARGGVFNTGIVFLKHTRGAKKFAEAWNAHLNAQTGRYSRLTSDQQVFNAMSRRENQWPGLDPLELPEGFPVTRVLTANGLLDGSTFRLGVLPVALFNPGHVYFLQRVTEKMEGVEPYGVHATYTFDGSTGAAKRLRFAEVGLWDVEADSAAEAAEAASGGGVGTGAAKKGSGDAVASGDVDEAAPRLLTFDPGPIVADLGEKPSIGAHLEGGTRQLAALRDAFAVAAILNRTLVVPRLTCFCDKVWGGHDNIFNFNCHYPGSADSGHIPGACPLDHFVNPSALRDAGVKFIAAAELELPPYAKHVRGRGTVEVLVTDPVTAEEAAHVEGAMEGTVGIPTEATESQLLRLLGDRGGGGGGGGGDAIRAAATAPLLKLSTSSGRAFFGGFETKSLADWFNANVVRGLNPPEWCSECHPQGCKNLIPAEVIAKGRLLPVRQVHDQFCSSFDAPKPAKVVAL